MPTQNGSVCPEGCGKLFPKMPLAVARVNAARICCDAIFVTVNADGDYKRPDDPNRLFRPSGRAIQGVMSKRPGLKAGEFVGIYENRVYIFAEVRKDG